MPGSKVEVATAALLRAWRIAEYTELWLEFKPHGGGDITAQVTEAMWAANEAFDEDDVEGDFAFGEGPWLAPMGPPAYLAVLSRTTYEEGVVKWLGAFADHLAAAGLAGRVTTVPTDDHPSFWMVNELPNPQLRTFLAYAIVDRAPSRDHPYDWNVDDEATARIAAQVEQAAFPGAETYFGGPRLLRTEPAVAAAALRRNLPRDCIASVTYVRPDPPRVMHTTFNVNGMSTRTLYDPQQSWQDRLVQCIDAMTTLAEVTDLGFVQYANGIYSGWNGLNNSPPALLGIREHHFRYNPHLFAQFVPDARGVLVVTDAHLKRAHDLGSWSVEPLGHGRHLVQATDLAAWFAQPEPAPEVLKRARVDFGGMILTLDDIAANPPPRPTTG